jgi:hypothetical protein
MKDSPLVAAVVLALTGTFTLSQSLPSTLPSRSREYYVAAPPPAHAWLFQIGGKHYRATITHDEVKAGPDWKPSMPLPLSFEKAEEIARAELKKLVGGTASWEVTDLQLKRNPGEDQSRWFYVIGMARREEGSQQKHDSFFAVMNLSGVVGKIEENTAAR